MADVSRVYRVVIAINNAKKYYKVGENISFSNVHAYLQRLGVHDEVVGETEISYSTSTNFNKNTCGKYSVTISAESEADGTTYDASKTYDVYVYDVEYEISSGLTEFIDIFNPTITLVTDTNTTLNASQYTITGTNYASGRFTSSGSQSITISFNYTFSDGTTLGNINTSVYVNQLNITIGSPSKISYKKDEAFSFNSQIRYQKGNGTTYIYGTLKYNTSTHSFFIEQGANYVSGVFSYNLVIKNSSDTEVSLYSNSHYFTNTTGLYTITLEVSLYGKSKTLTYNVESVDYVLYLDTTRVKSKYYYGSGSTTSSVASSVLSDIDVRPQWNFALSSAVLGNPITSGLSSSIDSLSEANKTLTISDSSKSTTYTFALERIKFKEIKTRSNTLYSQYATLVISSLEIYGIRNDSNEEITLTYNNSALSNGEWKATNSIDTDTEGVKTLEIATKYEGVSQTSTIDFTVMAIEKISINPLKTTYFVGESYDKSSDVEVYGVSSNNDRYLISQFYTNVEDGYTFRAVGKVKVIISFENDSSARFQQEYYINIILNNNGYREENTTLQPVFDIIGATTINGKTYTFGDGIYPLVLKEKTEIGSNGKRKTTSSYTTSDIKGYIVFGNNTDGGNQQSNAHIVLFDDYTNITHDGNIIAKFPHKTDGNADKINKCKFGHIYNNRLFVSGNSDYVNCDWHSSDVNRSQETYEHSEDFAYFADLDYCYYGTDDTAIVGYDTSRNGDLIVFKESSYREATLYRRTLEYTNVIDNSGNKLDYIEDRYSMDDINSSGGIGALNHISIVNYLGDSIFVAKDGLKKLSYRQNIYENAKYTYDISSKINNKIRNEDLVNSKLFVLGDKLFLVTNRGTYIGISDFRESEEYHELEWYYLDITNIKSVISSLDNYIIYGDNVGNIFKLDFNKYYYKDKDRTYIGSGSVVPSFVESSVDGVTLKHATNITYYQNVNENDIVHILGDGVPVYAYMGVLLSFYNDIDYSNNTFKVNNDFECSSLFYEGRIVYLDHINSQNSISISVNTPYRLVLVSDDIDYRTFALVEDGSNVIVPLSNVSSFRVSFKLDENYEARIVDIDSDNHTFKLKGDHDEVLKIFEYNDVTPTSYKAIITKEKNIEAYYITKPFDFGAMMYEKNIFMWTFANDTGLESNTYIKYYVSRKAFDYVTKEVNDSNMLNLSKTNFFAFSFENDMLPHIYTRQKLVPNINYLRLVFENKVDTNIILEQLIILYSLARTIKGGK